MPLSDVKKRGKAEKSADKKPKSSRPSKTATHNIGRTLAGHVVSGDNGDDDDDSGDYVPPEKDEESDKDSDLQDVDEDELDPDVQESIDDEGNIVRIVGGKAMSDQEILDSIHASPTYRKMREFKKQRWVSQHKKMKSDAKDAEDDPDDEIIEVDCREDDDSGARYAMLPVTDVDDIRGGVFKTGLGYTFEGKRSVWEIDKMRLKVKYDSGEKDHMGRPVWKEKEQLAAKIFADGSIAVRKREKGQPEEEPNGQRSNKKKRSE
ncbi:hypothetical protein N0V83_007599 [Neocucurbitaria cava]|uniref:Uncharacterized protein n=1 Tax=Neocucurbitaria cava TaxID=798079 RepID=A0A9W9CK52_9PLEO|nr:hypothetical protein N0V83_007599 [Neocucurbitaria cava]